MLVEGGCKSELGNIDAMKDAQKVTRERVRSGRANAIGRNMSSQVEKLIFSGRLRCGVKRKRKFNGERMCKCRGSVNLVSGERPVNQNAHV